MLAFYLHGLDPVAIRFSDSIVVRWYGLSYVAALVVAFVVILVLARRGLCEMKPAQAAPFMLLVGFVGVMIGGRLGNVVGYHWRDFWRDGLDTLGSWRGGMSSHGCIAGVTFVCLCYARWRCISWLGLLDTMACAGAPGVFLVRVGNFINGENLGRATHVPWAVKFPTEMLRADFVPAGALPLVPALPSDVRSSDQIIAFFEKSGLGKATLEAIVQPRHPVQLYEAFGSGLVLFAALIIIRFRFLRLHHGILAGLACVWYPVVRIVVEHYRQPELWETPVWGMTQGQLYSGIMFLIGIAVLIQALRPDSHRSNPR